MTVTDGVDGERSPDARPNPLRRMHTRLHANPVTGLVTKVVVTVVGVAVLCAGIVMMVTPGPGLVGIAVGLGILATEYSWAERWVRAARRKASEAAERAREMDPAERRRRLVVVGVGIILLAALMVGYLVVFDWPSIAVDGWDRVQDLVSVVPELPGM